MVPESPWAEGQKVQTLGGDTVWWEEKDGKKLASFISPSVRCKLTKTQIQPGGIEVSSIPNKVANGEVWVLEGARNYA